MNTTPVSGYPENPEKKTRLEQIKILVERHNFLVDQVSALESEFEDKEELLENFKELIKKDLNNEKKVIEQNKELIDECERVKKITSKSFKEIVKKTQYDKIKKRINTLNYENYIYRDELYRKINI
ncbi:MAG: hypothetical protein ACLFN8_01920 [Candidatus Woesearchaeota archaeon]